MIYNDEQWAVIRQASPHFESARHDYIRNAPKWLTERIMSVYEDATGKTIASRNLNCAVCVLHIYQTVGRTYFSDKAEREEIKEKELENAESENETPNEEPEPRDKKKAKGCPKKNKKGVAKGRD